MNDMTVGMENLPNVFIDKITVERMPNFLNYRIQVVLRMFDYEDSPSWRNRISGLQVKCAFIDDDRISGLNSGQLSLYDVRIGNAGNVMTESCDEFRFSTRNAGYESFTTTFEYYTPDFFGVDNLNVYVACFIDDLQFGMPMFDKFYGPMASDRIFVGGEPNTQSGYFYNPETNEEYAGPVHQHSSGYMEGSEHSMKPHAGLRYVTEENYKIIIQDFGDSIPEGPETPGGPQSGAGRTAEEERAADAGAIDPSYGSVDDSPPTEIYE